MRAHADAPDPIAAASAIVLLYAIASLPEPAAEKPDRSAVVAVAAGIFLALAAVAVMLIAITAQ